MDPFSWLIVILIGLPLALGRSALFSIINIFG